ncbi:MAG TPA: PadR family transcriptional regulator [Synergistales bacterium]|nr:PadR family transcriptional regulator [Synergistales bacterium]
MADLTGDKYWDGMINSALCKLFVLSALQETPMHGYALIQKIASMTDGFCVPTEGGLYPVLKEFESCGCATVSSEVVEGRTRKVYALTEKGRRSLQAGLDAWEKAIPHLVRALRRSGK